MAKKIKDLEEIKKLYEKGEISRSSFYRARKRGYVVVDYHKPHEQGGDTSWFHGQEILHIRNTLIQMARKAIWQWGQVGLDPEDLSHEAILYLYDRGEGYLGREKRFFSVGKSYVIGICRKKGKANLSSGLPGQKNHFLSKRTRF